MAVKKAVKKSSKSAPAAKAAAGKSSSAKAKPAASKPAVKKPTAGKAPAKKAAKVAKSKKPAAVKTSAKKSGAKPAAAKKPAVAKKAPAKKATVKKATVKKAIAKKAPAKQATARKGAASASAARKATAKAVKKPAAKASPAKTKVKTESKPAKAPGASAKKPVASRSMAGKSPVRAAAPVESATRGEGRAPLPPAHKPALERKLPRNVAVADVTGSAKRDKVRPQKVKVVPYKTDESGRPIIPKGYKPDPHEEYMSPLQLEYFRQRLLTWRADLVDESKQTIENLKEEVRDIGDEAERATRETENSLELRTRDRYRKLIGKIDDALKRVDDGSFGWCVDTGEEIGLDRLEARLTAERTIDAQERWEHRQKQMGD